MNDIDIGNADNDKRNDQNIFITQYGTVVARSCTNNTENRALCLLKRLNFKIFQVRRNSSYSHHLYLAAKLQIFLVCQNISSSSSFLF